MMAPSLHDAEVFAKGAALLQDSDPVMARIMAACGEVRLPLDGKQTHFEALVEAIVYQQLSGAAAERIYDRVLDLLPGRRASPEALHRVPDDALRSAGLSQRKVRYLKDLADYAMLPDGPLEHLHQLPDAEVEEALVRLRGVGRWSAQMFLIFRLGRPNVLPDGDLGIRKAVQRAYALNELPKPAQVRILGERWTPYRTIASLYLWRSLEKRG